MIDTHVEALDVFETTMVQPPGADLAQRIATGDPAVRALVAALDRPSMGEPTLVTRMRAALEADAGLRSRLASALAHLGVTDFAAYRARFPEVRLATEVLTNAAGPTTPACGGAKLRMRVAAINVHQESDIVLGDNIYCVVITEAGSGAEVRVTPPTPTMRGGDDYVYAVAEGIIWGQMDRIVDPEGNLLVTYNCLEQDSVDGVQRLLDAIGDAADGLGGIPGVNGWVFPTVGAVADIVSALLAFESDDRLFNVSQVIPAEMQFELTSGGWWSVRETGNFNLVDWDWELRVEAWGCADAVP